MVEPLVRFEALKDAGYGPDSRALKRLCNRYRVAVVELNQRQFALTADNYALLLQRCTKEVA